MAAGDHHAGAGVGGVGREVDNRRRHHAKVGDLTAAVDQALNQPLAQRRAGQATVAANHNPRLAGVERGAADGAAQPVDTFFGQAFAHNTANVVGAKDFSRQLGDADVLGAAIGVGYLHIEGVVFQDVDIKHVAVRQWRRGWLRRRAVRFAFGCAVAAFGRALEQLLNVARQWLQRAELNAVCLVAKGQLGQGAGVGAQGAAPAALQQQQPQQAA